MIEIVSGTECDPILARRRPTKRPRPGSLALSADPSDPSLRVEGERSVGRDQGAQVVPNGRRRHAECFRGLARWNRLAGLHDVVLDQDASWVLECS
jgi:hypothetical protein